MREASFASEELDLVSRVLVDDSSGGLKLEVVLWLTCQASLPCLRVYFNKNRHHCS